ncbi:hypothetical protein PS691_05336 [Pseudomonas fluorescens]|uniref:Polyketide cyclase n=2 Tax=Pseudomonas fluorescens TaxID=294 RepID=A0A5E7FAF0_PSEFL|nr:hypothetical protein PS691_05336 [Pseudomonas fluorescens]
MDMPASAAQAFEAFHNHDIRRHWDTLLRHAAIEGGHTHPFIGAISINPGRGLARLFSMRTRFVNYVPGTLAAAIIVEPAGPFEWWASSMHHRDTDAGCSELVYTFSLRLRPRWLGRCFNGLAAWLFERATRRRLTAMANYLANTSIKQ